MFSGTSAVRGDFLGFILAGVSIQHLWFRSETRKIKKKIIASSTESSAHMCERCGAIAIPSPKSFSERIEGAVNQVSKYIETRNDPENHSRP